MSWTWPSCSLTDWGDMHRYSIDDLIGWTRDGIVWWVAALVHLSFLVVVPHDPPGWWYNWFSWGDWWNGSDNDYHPFPDLGNKWLVGCWRLLEDFISESARWFTSEVNNSLRGLLGNLPGYFASFGAWVQILSDRLGSGFMYWAGDLFEAVNRLYSWIPNEVRLGGVSWSSLFDIVKGTVWGWVLARYESARDQASQSIAWLSQWGNQIAGWYQRNQAWLADFASHPTAVIVAALGPAWSWLENFQRNPTGFVLGVLGTTWARLVTFDQGPLTYLYNMWSQYRNVLSDFLADPGAWIMARIEAELNRIW